MRSLLAAIALLACSACQSTDPPPAPAAASATGAAPAAATASRLVYAKPEHDDKRENGWKGTQLAIVLADFSGMPGKVKASFAEIEHHDAKGQPQTITDEHGPDVVIQSIDDKTLRAAVVTPDPPAELVQRVDGTVVATICPPAT